MAKYLFQVIAGNHTQGEKNEDGSPKVYGPGSIVESDSRLDRRFENKFRRLSKREAEVLREDSEENQRLEEMTVAQLRAYAEAEEIDLGKAVKKDEILAAIRGTLAGVE